MKRFIIFLFVCNTMVLFGQKLIDNNTAKSLLKDKNIQLLDVRTIGEVKNGAINGSIHIDYFNANFIELCAAKLDPKKPLIVYCAAGGRSAKAAKDLKKEGFKVIYDLAGGYENWE